MTAASNSDARKRSQQAASNSESIAVAPASPSVDQTPTDTANGAPRADSERLVAIRARAEAATPGPWHWAGNTDTGEPYLATWMPGLGRCSVLAIGTEDRKTTGREADRVRSDAAEYDLGDPEDVVQDWATDRYGEPIKDPRLWFFTNLMADPARDHVVYEVAPNATDRDDPRVYRADITDVRHPDAAFIAAARTDVPFLLDELARVTSERDEAKEARDGHFAARNMLTEKTDRLEAQLAEVRRTSRVLPCDGLCSDYAEEDCSLHGREPAELWEAIAAKDKRAEAAEAAIERVRALLADGPDTWEGFDTRDIGHAFLADAVTDWTADVLAALDAAPTIEGDPR